MILFISADLVIKVVDMAYLKRPTNNQPYIICLSLFNIVSVKHESLVLYTDRIINGIKICFFYFYFFYFLPVQFTGSALFPFFTTSSRLYLLWTWKPLNQCITSLGMKWLIHLWTLLVNASSTLKSFIMALS